MNLQQLILFACSSLLLMTTPAPDISPVITRGGIFILFGIRVALKEEP